MKPGSTNVTPLAGAAHMSAAVYVLVLFDVTTVHAEGSLPYLTTEVSPGIKDKCTGVRGENYSQKCSPWD